MRANIRNNSLFILFILLFLCVSCTTYHIKTPPSGATKSFYKRNSTELKENARYDFSRLQKKYGLVIMSYEIEGYTGSNFSGRKPDIKSGIRIWEEKFSDKDWDIKKIEKTIDLWEENSFAGTYSSSKTSRVKIEVTFHKGRIVYGGRLFASNITDDLKVVMDFEGDCNNFLSTYQDQLADIKIDTALVKFLSRF